MIALCRLENRAFGESLSASAVQGRQLGEVHADEMLTSIKSILSDALKHWQVCECKSDTRDEQSQKAASPMLRRDGS